MRKAIVVALAVIGMLFCRNIAVADTILGPYDFNDNKVPSGWDLNINGNGTAGIIDGKFTSTSTDTNAQMTYIDLNENISEIIIEFEGEVGQSTWGNSVRYGFVLEDGPSYMAMQSYTSVNSHGDPGPYKFRLIEYSYGMCHIKTHLIAIIS